MNTNINRAFRVLTEEFKKRNCIVFVGNGIYTHAKENRNFVPKRSAPYKEMLKKLITSRERRFSRGPLGLDLGR